MSVSAQGTVIRGVARADEFEFSTSGADDKIFASNGTGSLNLTGMVNMKLPTAPGSAGDQLRLADGAGTLEYVTPGADAKIMALSMHGRFITKGVVTNAIVAYVAVDETKVTSGNVIAQVDYSYESEVDTTGGSGNTLDVIVYRVASTNTSDLSIVLSPIITDSISSTATINPSRKSAVQGTGQAASAIATYAVGITTTGTWTGSEFDIKDISITITAE